MILGFGNRAGGITPNVVPHFYRRDGIPMVLKLPRDQSPTFLGSYPNCGAEPNPSGTTAVLC
jgi:hypothetical protein